MLDRIEQYLHESLFQAHAHAGYTQISSGVRFDGDSMPCRIFFEEDKYCRITSANPFDEWLAFTLRDGWMVATPQIQEIANHFGVQWDEKEGCLFIRFRRNELSITQALIRLHTAMRIIGELNHTVNQI